MLTETKSMTLLDRIRSRASQTDISEHDHALRCLEIAAPEADVLLLVSGALEGSDTKHHMIDRIAEALSPGHARKAEAIEDRITADVSDDLCDVVSEGKEAAYYLGLALGLRIGGAR